VCVSRSPAQADPMNTASVVDWGINRLGWTVERTLEGEAIDEATTTAAVEHASDGVDALSDLHASGDYRLALA
jgi:xanthine dehydrogenase iron-sulfur cluster and FAD-binding subunit A